MGKQFLVDEAEKRKYPIDEEDLLEAVYLLFEKAEKLLVVEKAQEEALISIRYLFDYIKFKVSIKQFSQYYAIK